MHVEEPVLFVGSGFVAEGGGEETELVSVAERQVFRAPGEFFSKGCVQELYC